MTDSQARARVWTLCLAALVLAALTGPVAGLLTPLAHASSPALTVLAATLAVVLIGAHVTPRRPAHRRRLARRAASSGRPPLARVRSAAAASQRGATGPCKGRTAGSCFGTIVVLS
jgi:uncharacterized SAM-binding protein YcdF (DUF218 family)